MMTSHTKPSRGICLSIIAAFLLASISTALYAQDSLTIDQVEWSASGQELIVEGQSDTLNLVFLSDEITLEEFAQVQADDDGKWLINIKLADLPAIPCAISATSGGRSVYKQVGNRPANCSSATLTQELTANIYSEKLCDVCHGPTGSGDPGPNIEGDDLADIIRAIAEEEVHLGIVLSNRQAEALDAFLHNPGPLVARETPDFSDPEVCATCHPRQFKEWSGSSMAYSALSPTFSALEALGNAYSVSQGGDGFAAGNHDTALFCQSCHNPVDTALGNFPTLADSNGHPLRNFASKAGRSGLSCDVCHQINGPDTSTGLGRFGDGIANTAFLLNPGTTKYAPQENPQSNPIHDSAPAHDINGQPGYLRSSEFCGSCHDVRTPPDGNLAIPVDPETGEGFQRLENLFTEWQEGPYGPLNNSVGEVVSCQDCHMDLGPPSPAGSYAEGETTVYPRPNQVDEREEVRTHYFTGIDIALVDFPGQDDEARDENGNVIGQVQRRKVLMESAAKLAVTAPSVITAGEMLPIEVHVTNSGTGHNLPSGFSQERQIWIELIVSDGNGDMIYDSGTLVDTAHPAGPDCVDSGSGELVPDGNLDDEDLRNFVGPNGGSGYINPITMEDNLVHGTDFDRRHEDPPVNLGIKNFGNEFIRISVDENGVPMRDTDGHFIEEEVFMPFLSTHTDNGFSIPALETVDVPYDVDIPSDAVDPITVTARLRARAFPPRFLRALACGRPDLVNEKMVDRNRIVEMVSAAPHNIEVMQDSGNTCDITETTEDCAASACHP
jgi:hypothetical protein